MSDKPTFEELRALLNQTHPIWFQTGSIGPATVNTWQVVKNLLDIIEAQEQRIKQLEDVLRGDGK